MNSGGDLVWGGGGDTPGLEGEDFPGFHDLCINPCRFIDSSNSKREEALLKKQTKEKILCQQYQEMDIGVQKPRSRLD